MPGTLAALSRPALVAAWLVGSVGAIVIGVSGLLAEVLGDVFGAAFVAGDPPGVTYTPDRCADFFEYFPHARTCAEAAALHHFGEVVEYRVALGVLGMFALVALVAARRWGSRTGPDWTPPRIAVLSALVALFGVAGVGLSGLSLMELAFGRSSGVGADLSLGLVAAASAVGVIVWGLRRAVSDSGA